MKQIVHAVVVETWDKTGFGLLYEGVESIHSDYTVARARLGHRPGRVMTFEVDGILLDDGASR